MDDVEIEESLPLSTSTPRGSQQDLTDVLQTLKPFPQAPPRKEGARHGRKPGKTTILTADESFEEVQAEHEARNAKTAAVAARKAAAAAKKEAVAAKKLATAIKKATKKQMESAPKRISQRRKTVTAVSYVDQELEPEQK